MNKINLTKNYTYTKEVCDCDLFILASGFEERAFAFLSKSTFSDSAYCILIRFSSDVSLNDEIYGKYINKINTLFDSSKIIEVNLSPSNSQQYGKDLHSKLLELSRNVTKAWVDISGMPTHVICSTLEVLRKFYPNKKQSIIYTAATKYFPTFEDYEKLQKKQSEGIEFLPKSMALEMSEVLLLENFSGYRSKDGASCLAVFAGYDVNRSAGVIGSINPSILLLLYGSPGDNDLDWRLNLSKQLHSRFEKTRKTATEEVSTLQPKEAVQVLEEYYEFLYEDYDLTISPVCSKMQAVGAYLFWERYKEVKMVFPLPVGYSIEHAPKGVGKTYQLIVEPRNSLYHDLA